MPAFDQPSFFIAPAANVQGERARDRVERLIHRHGIWAFGRRLAARRQMKSGDGICFYATGIGVVAWAVLDSDPEQRLHGALRDESRFHWTVRLREVVLLKEPIRLTIDLRRQLDAFSGREPEQLWSWFVQFTHPVTPRDFGLLTGRS